MQECKPAPTEYLARALPTGLQHHWLFPEFLSTGSALAAASDSSLSYRHFMPLTVFQMVDRSLNRTIKLRHSFPTLDLQQYKIQKLCQHRETKEEFPEASSQKHVKGISNQNTFTAKWSYSYSKDWLKLKTLKKFVSKRIALGNKFMENHQHIIMKRFGLEGTSRSSGSTRPPRGLGFGFYFGGVSLFCVFVLGVFFQVNLTNLLILTHTVLNLNPPNEYHNLIWPRENKKLSQSPQLSWVWALGDLANSKDIRKLSIYILKDNLNLTLVRMQEHEKAFTKVKQFLIPVRTKSTITCISIQHFLFHKQQKPDVTQPYGRNSGIY